MKLTPIAQAIAIQHGFYIMRPMFSIGAYLAGIRRPAPVRTAP